MPFLFNLIEELRDTCSSTYPLGKLPLQVVTELLIFAHGHVCTQPLVPLPGSSYNYHAVYSVCSIPLAKYNKDNKKQTLSFARYRKKKLLFGILPQAFSSFCFVLF